ncbi:AI-2E family transporter [Gudongella sp. DL1XJH-153]|uniref:AI-2E family transporter n=1 Tax=Gudongella sp. DL1XJH-153 TaxID=3409804 RepID=UPI003BB57DCC
MRIAIPGKKKMFDIGMILLAVVLLMVIYKPLVRVINPFIYALVLAYILNPLVKFLEKRKMSRTVAILIVFLLFFGIIGIAFGTIIPSLTGDLSGFIEDIPNIVGFVENLIVELRAGEITFIPKEVQDYLNVEDQLDRLGEFLKNAFRGIFNVLVNSTGTLLDIIITPIITFYYLKDKDKILKALTEDIPESGISKLKEFGKDMDKVFGGFIKGQLTIAAFVGVLTGVGCFFIGVPYALTIGLVAGITNIIPYFGPWLGGVLPVILGFMERPLMALWVIILIVVIQQIEAAFLSPQIMSHSVGLHPLLVMFSVLFFGSMFGILGMIIGVPLMGILKVLLGYLKEFRNIVKTE